MSLPVIDFLFIIIIFAFAVFGIIKGFFDEILGKAIPVAAIWISFMTFGFLIEPMEKQLKNHIFAVACSFILIFVLVFLILKILQSVLIKIFSGDIFKSLDKFLGFVFGIIEGIAIVCLIILILKIQPWFDSSLITKGSIFNKFIEPIISVPANIVIDSVKKVSFFIVNNGVLNV